MPGRLCLWRAPRCRAAASMFLLLGVCTLAACGGSQAGRQVTLTQTPPSAAPARDSQQVSFPTADGVMLGGTLYGHGTRGVILSNDGDNESSRWRLVAQRLAVQGYLVLGYSYRYRGGSLDHYATNSLADLHAAVAFMRSRRVSRLALAGASLGALITAKLASADSFDAIVVISAPIGFQDVRLTDAELQGMTMPKLFVTSADNAPFTHDTLHMFDVTPQPKDKRVYPGSAHGLSLFDGESGVDLLGTLQQFLMSYIPAS